MSMTIRAAIGVSSLLLGFASYTKAVPVALQNATATFTQVNSALPGLWAPAKTIDGTTHGAFTSWAVFENAGKTDDTSSQTIVWETQIAQGLHAGAQVTFTLFQTDFVPAPDHNLGRFRLSYTTDDRAIFADGLDIGGDVSANWVVIDPLSFVSDGGETLTKLSDLSLLVSEGANSYAIYTVTTLLSVTGITGFRLEALEHTSLPFEGPGRQGTNGNFALSEFQVDIVPQSTVVPEPATAILLSSGLVSLVAAGGLRKRRDGSLPAARCTGGGESRF